MDLDDLSLRAYNALVALPYQRYLAAGWIISSELDHRYGSEAPPEWRPLIEDSLAMIRRAAESDPNDIVAEANEVMWRWAGAMGYDADNPDASQEFDSPVSPAHTNLWFVWVGLLSELGGESDRRTGISSVTLAVTTSQAGPARPCPAEFAAIEAREHAFGFLMLNRYLDLAKLLESLPVDETADLEDLREQVFADTRQPTS